MKLKMKFQIVQCSDKSYAGQTGQVGSSSDIGDIEVEKLEVIEKLIEVLDFRKKGTIAFSKRHSKKEAYGRG